MRNWVILFVLVYVVLSIAEVEFNLETVLAPVNGVSVSSYLWLFDQDGNGEDEIYVLYSGENSFRIAGYNFNGDSLSVFQKEYGDSLFSQFIDCLMFSYGDSTYLLAVNFIDNYEGCYYLIEVYDFNNGDLIANTSFPVSYQWFDNIYQINMVESEEEYYLYLGIDDYTEYRNGASWDSFMKKYLFAGDSLEFIEDIYNCGYMLTVYPDYEYLISMRYDGDVWFDYPPHTRKQLVLVSQDIPAETEVINSDEHDFFFQYFCVTKNDLNFQDYGYILWNSAYDRFTCYSSDFSEVIWENSNIGIENMNILASSCINTNLGDHFIIYFYSDYPGEQHYLEIRNRLNGYIALSEEPSIMPFKILRRSDDDNLLFFCRNDDSVEIYTLTDEIELENSDQVIQLQKPYIINYPNPFNPETRLVFNLPEASQVRLAVYNLKGQLVKVLTDEILPAGDNAIIWNGRNEMGRLVSSGVYLVRMQSEKASVMKKIMLIK